MLQYLLTSLVVALVAYIIFTWVIRPRRLIAHYVKQFKVQGFTVCEYK
jgi:hypothetical protein